MSSYTFKVGRADLCCDFQSPDFEMPNALDAQFRAKKWVQHGQGRHTTGLTYGVHQGALQVQLYKKSETLAADHKQWMFDVWAAQNQAFDAELPVYRCEIRFYRDGLRLMQDDEGAGLGSLWELHSSLADLCSYAISGDKPWIRFVDPETRKTYRNNPQKWANSDWWEHVRGAFGSVQGSQGRKRVNDELRFHYRDAVERCVAHLRTAAAIARLAGWHPATNPAKFASDALRAFYAESPLEWADAVNAKTAELLGHFSADVVHAA
ncbi:MAG: hypothetical protein ACR2N0_18135 [Rubrobacteraceae bacterium]